MQQKTKRCKKNRFYYKPLRSKGKPFQKKGHKDKKTISTGIEAKKVSVPAIKREPV